VKCVLNVEPQLILLLIVTLITFGKIIINIQLFVGADHLNLKAMQYQVVIKDFHIKLACIVVVRFSMALAN
jgi:hypothetical protein